jgi:transposase-like protein
MGHDVKVNYKNQFCDEASQNKMNCSGIYRLKCKTCNSSYVGQTGSSIEQDTWNTVRTLKQTTLHWHMHYMF